MSIFDLTYKDEQTTEDGKYLIPDKTKSRNRNSCAYTSSCNEHTGTNQYQKDLKGLVSVSVSYEGLAVESSFSIST